MKNAQFYVQPKWSLKVQKVWWRCCTAEQVLNLNGKILPKTIRKDVWAWNLTASTKHKQIHGQLST